MKISKEVQEQIKKDSDFLEMFMPKSELLSLVEGIKGEEGQYFIDKISETAALIRGMPKTYEQDGKGENAVVFLHYFRGGSDWYITEKDVDHETLFKDNDYDQAFGHATLNGDTQNAEWGYISIKELRDNRVELDLFFKPCTVNELKEQGKIPR